VNSYTRLRDIQQSHRGAVVGASEIATLALYNLRHGQTPATLWEEHTGRTAPVVQNDAMWWGHAHEPTILYRYVRDHFSEDTARAFLSGYYRSRSHGPFKVLTEFRRSITHGTAIAHPDLLIEGSLWSRITRAARGDELVEVTTTDPRMRTVPRLVQAKSHGYHTAKRKDDPDFGYDPEDMSQNGLPASVFLQEQWEMFCADLPEADVVPLIDTNDYREYGPVYRDAKTQEQALALAERFCWHVERDVAPDPEAWIDIVHRDPVMAELSSIHPLESAVELRGEPVTLADMLASHAKAKGDERRALRRQEDIKTALGVLLGGNKWLTTPEGQVIAGRIQSEYLSLSLKDLRQVRPDLAALVEPFAKTVHKDYLDIR
jgi:hypothetical protein